jgi:hypothetical protein
VDNLGYIIFAKTHAAIQPCMSYNADSPCDQERIMSSQSIINIVAIDEKGNETKEYFKSYKELRHYNPHRSKKKKTLQILIKHDGLYRFAFTPWGSKIYLEFESTKERFELVEIINSIFDVPSYIKNKTYKILLENMPDADEYNLLITLNYLLPQP